MAEFSAQGRRRAAQGDRRRDDGLQEGARGDRRRPRGGQGLAAREGPRRRGKLRRPRGRPRVRSTSSSTATSARSSSSTARPTSWPRAPTSPAPSPTLTKLVAANGDADVAALPFEGSTVGETLTQLAAKLGENVELGRVVRFETTDGLLDGYTAHPERPRHHRRARRARRRRPVERDGPGGRARDRAAHLVRGAAATSPATTCPADVLDTERAVHRGEEPQRGQARGASSRMRSRVGSTGSTRTRAARAGVGEGPEGHDRQAGRGPRRRRHAPRFARVKVGED